MMSKVADNWHKEWHSMLYEQEGLCKMEHTKGIWEAVLTPYGFCILADNIKTAIAERYFDLKPTVKELKELHANAALIATAPGLLDACKMYQERIELFRTMNKGVEINLGSGIGLTQAEEKGKKAIAKAEK